MPNILKYFSAPVAESYRFPDAKEFEAPKKSVMDAADENEIKTISPEPEVREKTPEPLTPVGYAQLQADTILREARREAEEILEKALRDAEAEADAIRQKAKQEGFDQGVAEGVIRGMEQAMEECRRNQEENIQEMGRDVQEFLKKASRRVDRVLDEHVEELRDLAIAIAEKVVCVSLKSSSSVIGRMIQNAIDKRKRREWVQIYIAECDVKHLTPIPSSLAGALESLSDRVRIVPIADDEPGTCIIEMPDEIVDASASTQIKNIRTALHKTPLPSVGNEEN